MRCSRPRWAPYWICVWRNGPVSFLWPHCVPYPRKHRDRHQIHQFWVDSYRLMTIRRFRRPSWTPSWKKLFWGSDFGKILVCCKVHENLTESIEKPFVAIFWGLNCILTGLVTVNTWHLRTFFTFFDTGLNQDIAVVFYQQYRYYVITVMSIQLHDFTCVSCDSKANIINIKY